MADDERDDSEFDPETGDNLTQQRTSEDPRPVDASWEANEMPAPEDIEEPDEDTFSKM